MDLSLSKLRDIVNDGKAWRAAVHGIAKSQNDLATEQPQLSELYCGMISFCKSSKVIPCGRRPRALRGRP